MAPKDYSTYLKLERLKEENNTQKLIRLYRANECLWNPQSSGYHSASVKDDAWRRVTRLMNSGLTPDQVKLQVLALRNYYDKECTAIRKSQLEGYSYLPRHAYFEDLHFLKGPDGLTDSKGVCLFFPQHRKQLITVSLCPGSSETKDNYTFYKLILEPEQASLSIKSRDGVEGIIGRSASGNDRWYPTSYCVKCGQETGENPCTACCGRGKRFCAPREPSLTSLSQDDSYYSVRKPQRRNQFDDDQCSYSRCSQPRQNFRSNYKQPQSQGPRYPESSCDSVCSEGTYVDMDNSSDDWPSPHLCGQRRPKVTPRYRYAVSDHGLKECCSNSWDRNNEAIFRRLQAQLAKQSNQNKCSTPSQNSGRGSCNRNFRYQSGEDELNVMLLKDTCRCRQPQAINCQCPVHAELYNNNLSQQDPGRFEENQPNPQAQSENPPMQVIERYNDDQVEVPDRYNNEQKNYTSFPCDCQCNSFRQQFDQPPSYYQQNQYEDAPTSYPLPPMPDTTAQIDEYGEMGVPCPFLTDLNPSTAEPQAHVYCYSTEMWPQDAGMCETCKKQKKSCWSTCPVCRRNNDDRSELACDTVCNGPCSSNRGAPDNRNVYSEEPVGVVNQKIPSNNPEELPPINSMPEQEDKSLDGRQRADVGESSDERSKGRPYSRENNEEPSVRSQRDDAMGPFLEGNFCNEAACREGRDCRIGYEDRPRQQTDRNDESSTNSNYSNQGRRIREDVPGPENPENQPIQQQPLNENNVQDQKFKAYPLSTDISQVGQCPESCSKYRRNGDYRDNRKNITSDHRNYQERNRESINSRSKDLDDRYYQDGKRGSVSSRSKDEQNKNYSKERPQKARNTNRDADENFCTEKTCNYKKRDSSKQNETEERNKRRKSTESEKILSDNEKNYTRRPRNNRDADENFCSDETCKYKRKDSSKQAETEVRKARRKLTESEKILSDNERDYTNKSRNNSPSKSPRYQTRTRSVEKRKKSSPSSKNSNNDDCDCDWDEKLREERSERYKNPAYDEEYEEMYQNDSPKGGDRSGRGFLNYHLANPDEDGYDDDNYSDDDRGNYTERDTRKKRNLDDCRCIEEAPATSSRRRSDGRTQRSDPPRYDNRRKRDDYDNGYDENEEAYHRNRNPRPAPPKEMKVTSPYHSEYDCLCSDEDLYQRNGKNGKDRNGKGPSPKEDQNQRTSENTPTDATKDKESTDDDKQPQETEENDTVCECHSDSDEKMKADDPEADGVRVTRSSAGNGLVSSKSPFLSKVKKSVPLGLTILAPICINNKQFEVVEKFPIHDMTTFSLKEQVQSSQDSAKNPIPVKKKPTHNNNGASTSFANPSRASPNRRGSVTPKSQMVEPTKRRTQVSSFSSPQSKHMTPLGNRRPTTRKQEYTKDSDNCKFPFDINSAQYYICKLQDDGSANQYLILMPMEAIGGLDGLREVPGQSSAKDRRYCPRQSSGFQSVSWAHPESTNQSQESQQSERLIPGECNSILDTIELIKSHIASEGTDLHKDPKKSIPISRKIRRKAVTKSMTSKPRKASQKANTKGVEENRTVVVSPKGDVENIDQPIVFLHPPVADFRPSRYSFDKEMVEQHIKGPDTAVHPAPKPLERKAPKPPAKPKRTVLR
ncbi:hypothetical protein KR074_008654 [Drosophila pseudoananassae]|nr:hypothetical protein KR074_008654 [Drosophila pseudoananassae]